MPSDKYVAVVEIVVPVAIALAACVITFLMTKARVPIGHSETGLGNKAYSEEK